MTEEDVCYLAFRGEKNAHSVKIFYHHNAFYHSFWKAFALRNVSIRVKAMNKNWIGLFLLSRQCRIVRSQLSGCSLAPHLPYVVPHQYHPCPLLQHQCLSLLLESPVLSHHENILSPPPSPTLALESLGLPGVLFCYCGQLLPVSLGRSIHLPLLHSWLLPWISHRGTFISLVKLFDCAPFGPLCGPTVPGFAYNYFPQSTVHGL